MSFSKGDKEERQEHQIRHLSLSVFRGCSTQATTENQLKPGNLETENLPQGVRSGNLEFIL